MSALPEEKIQSDSMADLKCSTVRTILKSLLTDGGCVEQRLLLDERDRVVPEVDARSEERLGESRLDVLLRRFEGDLPPRRRFGSGGDV